MTGLDNGGAEGIQGYTVGDSTTSPSLSGGPSLHQAGVFLILHSNSLQGALA